MNAPQTILAAGRTVIRTVEAHPEPGTCCENCLEGMLKTFLPIETIQTINWLFDKVGHERANAWITKLQQMADKTRPTLVVEAFDKSLPAPVANPIFWTKWVMSHTGMNIPKIVATSA